MSVSILTTARELHSRVSDGIHVRLMWSDDDGRLWVSVCDRKRNDEFSVDVRDRSRALGVFRHPFSYAAYYGVGTGLRFRAFESGHLVGGVRSDE
jgi:hypothetical protein